MTTFVKKTGLEPVTATRSAWYSTPELQLPQLPYKPMHRYYSIITACGVGGVRTRNLQSARLMLSLLSYNPFISFIISLIVLLLACKYLDISICLIPLLYKSLTIFLSIFFWTSFIFSDFSIISFIYSL